MAESATLNHAALVLATVSAKTPADAALREYFAKARHVGPTAKRSISRALFTYFRWRQWLKRDESWQRRIEESLTFQARFDQNPNSFKLEALAARALPDWLKDEVVLPPETLRQLQREPALWLRSRPGQGASLAGQLRDCEPADAKIFEQLGITERTFVNHTANQKTGRKPEPETKAKAPDTPTTALRYNGFQDLFITPQFQNGEFEIQDLASQFVGYACSPKPSETWWDACAGEGGKLLHLADLMGNKGLIWASDRSERRLLSLKRRTARAKLFNYRSAPWDGSARLPTKTKFDGVLLDAPCSGVGTWQRNPHARWTTTQEDVNELSVIQGQMLNNIAPSLKPGGRLVYAVCTLTKSETTAVANAFTAAHPEFEPVAVFSPPEKSAASLSTPAGAIQETDTLVDTQVTIWPHQFNSNGMFIAAWRRRKE